MILSLNKKNIINTIYNYFPWIIEIYNKFFSSSERLISREEMSSRSKAPNKIFQNHKYFNKNLYEIVHEPNARIENQINSVFGWLPYIENRSKIFLYNFFSQNYALKKNIFLRLSLVDGLKIIQQDCFWVPPNAIHEFDLKDIWKNLKGSTIFVEAFHPKLPKNHGGSEGHFRCWGNYYNYKSELTCTSHSLNLMKKIKYSKKAYWPRSMISSFQNEKTIHFSRSYKSFKKNFDDKTQIGFSMILDKNNDPLSVWHNGGKENKNSYLKSVNSKKTLQSFWCLPSKTLDPEIFIDSKETQLRGNTATFYLIKNKEIFDQKQINFEGDLNMSVSKIFNERLNGPYTIAIEFFYNNFAYCNISYNTINNSGDNVHAHESYWKKDKSLFEPENREGISTARKFFHFKNKDDTTYYALIHISKKIKFISNKIKLRILLDNGEEYLKNIDVNFDKMIMDVNLGELFNFSSFGNFKNGVIQLESLYDNMSASFLHYQKSNEHIIIDHFTGG